MQSQDGHWKTVFVAMKACDPPMFEMGSSNIPNDQSEFWIRAVGHYSALETALAVLPAARMHLRIGCSLARLETSQALVCQLSEALAAGSQPGRGIIR